MASRLILDDRAAFDLELRDYYVSGPASSENDGSEDSIRGVPTLIVRMYNLLGNTFRHTIRDGTRSMATWPILARPWIS